MDTSSSGAASPAGLPTPAPCELTGDPGCRLPASGPPGPLGLVSVTRDVLLDRRTGWAHVSELPDPRPYLTGGELLLTAGLELPTESARSAAEPARPATATATESAGSDVTSLAEVLRAWLGCHGGWDRTAELTGLHRNSVRLRMRHVEALLGVDLSDAAVRAELLLALGRLGNERGTPA